MNTLPHTGEKMRWSRNQNLLSARADGYLHKRLQHVANADADVAVCLWKLLYTTIRHEGCTTPPPYCYWQTSLTRVTSLTQFTVSPNMLLQISLGAARHSCAAHKRVYRYNNRMSHHANKQSHRQIKLTFIMTGIYMPKSMTETGLWGYLYRTEQ